MLVYLTDNTDFYKGNNIEFSLKNGVAKAGGTQRHYNVLNELIKFSLWNKDLNMPLHDTRAGQALLFLYPTNIRIFLSLMFYRQEQKILSKYSDNTIIKNINTPSIQLQLNSYLNKVSISSKILEYLNSLPDNFTLTDDHLPILKLILRVEKSIDFEEANLKQNLEKLFSTFSNKYSFNDSIISTSYNNNRLEAASAICRTQNFNKSGTNLILQTIEKWQSQYLNI